MCANAIDANNKIKDSLLIVITSIRTIINCKLGKEYGEGENIKAAMGWKGAGIVRTRV
jgi:hypothetical protein